MKNKTSSKVISLLAILAILLAASGCRGRAKVGELQLESKTVELGDIQSVRVEINLGAGELDVAGGADELLEANFSYNVAALKPEVEHSDGVLTVRHPDVKTRVGSLWNLEDYRNEWLVRLNDKVPTDLSIALGAGEVDLQLAGLSLTGLDIDVGAARGTIDLRGDWARDLDVTVKAGLGSVVLVLPRNVGVRVEVKAGIGNVDAPGLVKEGNVYTNDAYGVSERTLRMDIEAGVGNINLELEQAAARAGPAVTDKVLAEFTSYV
jgi:hypothetical protein